MAPSDFPFILIDGIDRALSDDHPLLSPTFKSCAVCYTSTWRRCSKCGNIWYCSKDHESAHRGIHSRLCSGTDPVRRPVKQKTALVEPLKYYDITSTERIATVAAYYFNPRCHDVQQIDIKYRPGGCWSSEQPMGPCPVLGKYFPEDTPVCLLLESDGLRDFTEPIAIWYSEKAHKGRKTTNAAIVSLFNPWERPKRSWTGSVIAMKFSSSNYYDFVPVTTDDLVHLKTYFANYVGLDVIN